MCHYPAAPEGLLHNSRTRVARPQNSPDAQARIIRPGRLIANHPPRHTDQTARPPLAQPKLLPGKRVVATPGRKAIVYGAESLLFTPDSADYVRELGGTDIPIIAIPEARHHLMLDQPLAFVTALRTLLEVWQNNENTCPTL